MLPRFDDDDGSSSLRASANSLASLFADEPPSSGGSSSLGFQNIMAPQEKKQEAKPMAKPPPPAAEPETAATITLFASLVQAFRSVDGAWRPAGQAGLALVGGPLPKPFQLVLYEPHSKRPFSIATVNPSLALGTPSAQYVSLEDDQRESWSVHFSSLDDSRHLLQVS